MADAVVDPKKTPTSFVIPRSQLYIDKDSNVRKRLSDESIQEMADLISSQGQITPVLVRGPTNIDGLDGPRYPVIAGFRRSLALELLGADTVLVQLPAPDQDNPLGWKTLALVENIGREDMNGYDIALGIADVRRELAKQSSTDDDAVKPEDVPAVVVSKKIGKSVAYVTQHLELLKLPQEVQLAVRDGEISYSTAMELNKLADSDQQIEFLEKVQKGEMKPKDVKAEIARLEVADVHEVTHVADEEAPEEQDSPDTTPTNPGDKKATKEAKRPPKVGSTAAPKKAAGGELVEYYKSVKMKPLNEKKLRAELIELAGKLERATSDKSRDEYGPMLKGLAIAAGIQAK